MNSTDSYLVKLKNLGCTDEQIAARLETTPKVVAARWAQLCREAKQAAESGYYQLCDAFDLLCLQYQLVGESLKTVGGALGALMEEQELRELWDADPEVCLKRLQSKAIVLRPYVPPPPSPNTPAPEAKAQAGQAEGLPGQP